ncbi:MAG TPA: cupin domain-containing protein [Candidatus Limnocylindria bacterium]|nr:cupin domain-containing protein [Candidatus Limnocylindria bacterium]
MKTESLAELLARLRASGEAYLEFLRVESMSAGLHLLPAGGTDEQSPHAEDEVYVVLGGRSLFTAGAQTREVQPTDTIFVPAGEEHRFHDISEELRLIVVFAPAEGSRAG